MSAHDGGRATPAPRSRRLAWALETANLLSGIGNALVIIALPWLVLERTGSPRTAGAVAAVGGVAIVVASPLVGAAVDRFGRRTMSMVSDAASLVAAAGFPLADRAGRLGLATIVVLTVIGSAFDPAAYTARKSMVPTVASRSGMDVARLTGIHEGVYLAGWTIGPVVGAWAIATVSDVGAMTVAAVAFAGAMLAVSLVDGDDPHGVDPEQAATPGWRTLVEGVRLLVRDRVLAVMTLVVMGFLLLYLPTESVLLPVHFNALDEPRGLGLTISTLAGGAAIGAFGFGTLSRRLTRRTIVRGSVGATAVAVALMATLPPLPGMMLAAFLLGLGWGPMEPLLTTLVQERVPASAHGRVFGLQLSLYFALPPFGQALAGQLAERFGVASAYAGLAAGFCTAALVVALLPTIGRLDAPGPA